MQYRLIVVAALVLGSMLRPLAAPEQSDELKAVLERAAQYVALYEDRQLGNLLAAENYVQNAAWYAPGGRGIIRRRQQRRNQSDFLILNVGLDDSN
jgi:hypothetical protein